MIRRASDSPRTAETPMRMVPYLPFFLLALAGCVEQHKPDARSVPDLYASLARPGAQVDPAAARDIISIYRRNKGLSLLRLDPALQRVAQRQAHAMATHGGAGAKVRSGLAGRLKEAGVDRRTAVQNISSGYHTLPEAFSGLATIAAAQRQYAERGRPPHGDRHRLCARDQIQGLLGARLDGLTREDLPASHPFVEKRP